MQAMDLRLDEAAQFAPAFLAHIDRLDAWLAALGRTTTRRGQLALTTAMPLAVEALSWSQTQQAAYARPYQPRPRRPA